MAKKWMQHLEYCKFCFANWLRADLIDLK